MSFQVQWRLGEGHPWSAIAGGTKFGTVRAADDFLATYLHNYRADLAPNKLEYRIIEFGVDGDICWAKGIDYRALLQKLREYTYRPTSWERIVVAED